MKTKKAIKVINTFLNENDNEMGEKEIQAMVVLLLKFKKMLKGESKK